MTYSLLSIDVSPECWDILYFRSSQHYHIPPFFRCTSSYESREFVLLVFSESVTSSCNLFFITMYKYHLYICSCIPFITLLALVKSIIFNLYSLLSHRLITKLACITDVYINLLLLLLSVNCVYGLIRECYLVTTLTPIYCSVIRAFAGKIFSFFFHSWYYSAHLIFSICYF